jgi:ABC-type amino acid transport substrate-binding protein
MKKTLTLLAAAAVLLAAAGCAGAAKPLEGKKYVLAINATFSPYEFVQADDSGGKKIVGFDIDVLNTIAENLGFTYDLEDMNFSGLIGQLQSGRADFVISGMSPTEERRKSVDFSVPYFHCKTALVSPAAAPLKGLADMKGKDIAAVFGTNYANVIEIAGARPQLLDNSVMVMQELRSGRTDGIVMDATQAYVNFKDDAAFTSVILPAEELESKGWKQSGTFAIAFQKGSELVPLFNQQIEQMEKDGTMKKLIVKWMGESFLQ